MGASSDQKPEQPWPNPDTNSCRSIIYFLQHLERMNARLGTVCKGAIFISIVKADKICIQAEGKSYQKHVGLFSQLLILLKPVKLMSFVNFTHKIIPIFAFSPCSLNAFAAGEKQR
jgi:hypothetical protein